MNRSATNMSARGAARRRGAFTLVELLVVIAIIGILVALLLPAVQAAREAARRAQCQSNLKNASLAVINYESAQNEFPAAISSDSPITNIGTNLTYKSTWLIDTLPYLEEQPLFDTIEFNQRHTGGQVGDTGAVNYANILARGTEIAVLKCPSDPNNEQKFETTTALGGNWARGNYAGNVGVGQWLNGGTGGVVAPAVMDPDGKPSAAWRGASKSPSWPASIRGVFGPNDQVRLSQIIDGTSKTIMLAEIRTGFDERDWRGAWALPHPGGSLIANHGSGGDSNGPNNCARGGKADDQPSSLTGFDCASPETNNFLLNECMTCNNDNVFAQAAPRSVHPGGVFAALVDGSVSFISDDIEVSASGGFGRCCKAWDHLIMAADENFELRGGR